MISKINQIFNLLNLYDNISLYNHKSEQEKAKIRTNNIITDFQAAIRRLQKNFFDFQPKPYYQILI